MDPPREERRQLDNLLGFGGPLALFDGDVGRTTAPQVGGGGFLGDAPGLAGFGEPLAQDAGVYPIQVGLLLAHATPAFRRATGTAHGNPRGTQRAASPSHSSR